MRIAHQTKWIPVFEHIVERAKAPCDSEAEAHRILFLST
jgi:hypothetical protein